jgi:uroporphyrin-III C-methyltransferase
MQRGKVIFIGAGPGDPELLTLKAVKHLAAAEVVLIDRLANDDITKKFAPQAQIIAVGKQSNKEHSTPQQSINEMLVAHALAGKYVVRLKGGDISIFSNMLDELEAIQEHHIPFELVPGITAAIGTAAFAGVPLTARGISRGVRLLTYYTQDAIADTEWQNLADTTDTLVFYMSGASCFTLAQKLLQFGKDADTPILLAEQATTPLQRFSLSTISTCEQDWNTHEFLSPALLIIGKAAALHQQYAWSLNTEAATNFFEPIEPIHR